MKGVQPIVTKAKGKHVERIEERWVVAMVHVKQRKSPTYITIYETIVSLDNMCVLPPTEFLIVSVETDLNLFWQ